MSRAFYTLLIAQFLSALADNAMLIAAIALLQKVSAPSWHQPLLLQFFVISYILLAPFVGSVADSMPKGRVMFISNGIKFFGSLSMMFGMPPLYAYGIVGIGAAAYSPAKYGILTEMLPPEELIKANGWMEGSTVAAIILGAMGGAFAQKNAMLAMVIISALYLLAAIFNHFIPKLPIDHKPLNNSPWYMVKDFYHSFMTLWCDPKGQVSLAVTTLFWGVGATLRLVVIAWAAYALHFNLEKSTQLMAYVVFGVAIGSVIAAKYVSLENSIKVLPAGIAMGALVLCMQFVTDWHLAAGLLFVIGALSGFFLVPLNALLQHRGHLLIGAGHSIAVQNFNENLGILLLSGAYTLMTKAEFSMNTIIAIFGLFICLSMGGINRYYRKQIGANA